MRTVLITSALLVLVASGATADQSKTYRWVDHDGEIHYGDTIPAEYAELPKQILNDHGVTIDYLQGKKTPEQIEADRKAAALDLQKELQRRADQALLATYDTEEEIIMHRDRRVELFQAQARVTELYLRNLDTRLRSLLEEASGFKPYSSNRDAVMIDPGLAEDIRDTRTTIERHRKNLVKYKVDEQQIIERFDGDIHRFKTLRGLDG